VDSFSFIPFPEPQPATVALALLLMFAPVMALSYMLGIKSLNGDKRDVSVKLGEFFIHAVVSSSSSLHCIL
jgi:hypothetical protein